MSELIVKRTTLKQQVYDYLKDSILLGEFNPGERLIEEKIAETLNVSRSPIREAVRMLEKDGLLNVHQTGGVTVVNPTIEDYRSLYEVRVEMESLAAYFAAERCDDSEIALMETSIQEMAHEISIQNLKGLLRVNFNFHEIIVRASRNPFLISMTLQLRGINSFYRRAIVEGDPRNMENALRDHEEIFFAIRKRDPDFARECMRKHIEHDYQAFMKAVQK